MLGVLIWFLSATTGSLTQILTEDFGYLADRPTEPIFVPKGNGSVAFEVPKEYLAERYQVMDSAFFLRYRRLPSVRRSVRVQRLPDMPELPRLPRAAAFSPFIPQHREMATSLVNTFLAQRSLSELMSTAVRARECVNPQLFVFALSVALAHRNDTQAVRFPPLAEIFPERFFDGAVFAMAREEASTVLNAEDRVPVVIPIDFTASELEPEHRVAYFREDVRLNMHHWYWHIIYPHDGPTRIVAKDRRGELFYYLHQQILARKVLESLLSTYNFERFSVQLPRVQRLLDFRIPIPEAYFPKLTTLTASRAWPGRSANTLLSVDGFPISLEAKLSDNHNKTTTLTNWAVLSAVESAHIYRVALRHCDALRRTVAEIQLGPGPIRVIGYYGSIGSYSFHDINRPLEGLELDVQDLERWRDRLFDAIHFGFVTEQSGRVRNISSSAGIDILGNLVESTILSLNRPYYGNMHNFGHVALAFIHDPDDRHLESFAVMGDTSTSLRDPVFYRWHAFVNDLFVEHKNTLSPYAVRELDFPDVRIDQMDLQTKGSDTKYEIATFLEQSDLDLSRGLDFVPRGPLFVRITHLQHKPFAYTFKIESKRNVEGFIRIFLAPTNDERDLPMPFEIQRNFMIEMDRFHHSLRAGSNTVVRQSNESSVTGRHPPDLEGDIYCGCGWPQHLLVPRGSEAGLPARLFAMVTDYSQDGVGPLPQSDPCSASPVLCGVRGGPYPDRRPMGFPFDRPPRAGATTLRAFLTPNMIVQDVVIRFSAEEPIRPDNRSRLHGLGALRSLTNLAIDKLRGIDVFNSSVAAEESLQIL